MADGIYTVSELTDGIKEHLETSFPFITLRAEISNFKRHSSGHLYFTLKDDRAQIAAIIWRTRAAQIGSKLEDGIEVIVKGHIEVYAPQGKYQIICDSAKPVGEGFLQKEFERLVKKLQADGLFDESRKKPLPRLPERIGIITSPTGAVIEDIKTVIARRFPSATLVLFPVRVQGDGASSDIAAALRYANTLTDERRLDVLIVGRGGGSLEDLWAFNDEAVARAIFQSRVPVISAVGHQTDITISDLVADVRAGTPSMAAEMVTPSRDAVISGITNALETLRQTLHGDIETKLASLREVTQSYGFNRPLRQTATLMQTLDRFEERLTQAMNQKFLMTKTRLETLTHELVLLGHEHNLKRGYIIALRNGKLIRRASDIQHGDTLTLKFFDGEVRVSIEKRGGEKKC
jgi:exodeoxyribonuclease VII large subunit